MSRCFPGRPVFLWHPGTAKLFCHNRCFHFFHLPALDDLAKMDHTTGAKAASPDSPDIPYCVPLGCALLLWQRSARHCCSSVYQAGRGRGHIAPRQSARLLQFLSVFLPPGLYPNPIFACPASCRQFQMACQLAIMVNSSKPSESISAARQR